MLLDGKQHKTVGVVFQNGLDYSSVFRQYRVNGQLAVHLMLNIRRHVVGRLWSWVVLFVAHVVGGWMKLTSKGTAFSVLKGRLQICR